MNWQEVTALVIVVATAAAFGWSRFRPRKFNFQRDTHCGCSSAGHNSPPPSIRFHARKGEAARVIVKTK